MKIILEEIINKKKLTKTELKIANFFLENKNSLFFFTALEIGEKLGISDTSVIRFVKSLGFKSFTEFKDSEISNVSSKILTPSEKLSLNQSALKKDDILNYFLEEVNIGLKECLNDESLKKIQLIADILKNAEKKYIISFKTAGEITDFFGLRLGFILDNVSTYKEVDLKLATIDLCKSNFFILFFTFIHFF